MARSPGEFRIPEFGKQAPREVGVPAALPPLPPSWLSDTKRIVRLVSATSAALLAALAVLVRFGTTDPVQVGSSLFAVIAMAVAVAFVLFFAYLALRDFSTLGRKSVLRQLKHIGYAWIVIVAVLLLGASLVLGPLLLARWAKSAQEHQNETPVDSTPLKRVMTWPGK